MLLSSIKPNDWVGVRKNFQKLGSLYLGERSVQTFADLTLTNLTASLLLSTDGDKKLTSVSDLTAWVAGTANQITVTDDADGTVTLSLPQDYDTAATPTLAQLTLPTTCTLAAGLNVLRVTGLQTDGTAMTGTLRGAYIDVSNGSTAATGTIRGMELKARTEAPGDTGNDVAVLEGLSISADSKAHSVTTMRAAEFILDGKTAGTIDEAVGLRIANNLQIDKATTSYGLQIYRDSFDYTADIQLSSGGLIGGSTGALQVTSGGNVGVGTTAITASLTMGDDKLIAVDVNAGLTASTAQEQGQGALTAQANEISTVANNGDNVTLPAAVTGIMIEIINNGANTLQIFPASGDDLGLGVNVAEELEANESVGFIAYDTTNWAKEFTTEIIHAEIHDEDNTDAFVINDAGGDFHSYHTNGLTAGDLANWTFGAGGAGTSFPIASIADGADSGVDIAVTTTGLHGLAVGDIVSQTNLTNAAYVGIFEVKAIISTTVYEVAAVYTATDTGTIDQAATLEADAVAAGVYDFAYYISAKAVNPNETFDFQLYKEATVITGSKIRRKFGAGGDFGSMSGGGVVSVASGEKISFALSNENSAANLTIRNLTIVLVRL